MNSHTYYLGKLVTLILLNAVCEKVLDATSSLITATEIQLDLLLHFLSTIPRDFTDISGTLRNFLLFYYFRKKKAHARFAGFWISCSLSPGHYIITF